MKAQSSAVPGAHRGRGERRRRRAAVQGRDRPVPRARAAVLPGGDPARVRGVGERARPSGRRRPPRRRGARALRAARGSALARARRGAGRRGDGERMTCPACGHENPEGQKFCGECGTPLARTCPSCGTSNAPTLKFCGECGTALAVQAPAVRAATSAPSPQAERRLVSVLFADLVGFTTASENRDAEDTRELLSRYFEHRAHADRALRRNGREVHRRRGDGGLGHAGRAGGRRRAGRPRGARPRRGRPRARRRAAGPRRRPHRRGRGHARRRGPGDGRRRPRQHRLARAVGGRAGHGPRRGVDQARIGGGHRLRGAGEHELKGKAEPVPLWRALRVDRRPRRRAQVASAWNRPSSGATASFGW